METPIRAPATGTFDHAVQFSIFDSMVLARYFP